MKGRGKRVDRLRGRECGQEHEVLLNRKVGPFVSDVRSRRVGGATWSKLMIVGPRASSSIRKNFLGAVGGRKERSTGPMHQMNEDRRKRKR